MNNAVRLAPAFVVPAAKSVARRSGLIAFPALIFAGLVIAVCALLFVKGGSDPNATMPTLYLPFVAVFAGGAGIRALVTQRRATLAGVKANADPMSFWYLDGFVVIPYVRGVPDRTLSFKVPPAMRMKLAQTGRYVPPP